MKEFYSELPGDKININWNKNPIKMELFISFITVELERSKNHLGSSNGWTLLIGDGDLEIGGGIVRGVEYLNKIQYGRRLDNHYNNYVNPFYLFDILNDKGKKFFLGYYADDIQDIFDKVKLSKEATKRKAERAEETEFKVLEFWAAHNVFPVTA